MQVEFNERTYYTIKDLASAIGVTSKTVKNWEREGYLPEAQRHPIRNWRLYTQKEIDKLVKHAKENHYFRTPKNG